ncbi:MULTISPECIES: ATP-binding protein [Flavobacteriaceae]|uniref:histidine kinase n=2 Tax=Flavobacteriaceae TaxID=49546 RepID=A0A4Y8AVN8_9FLAO|nr:MULTISPECIES: ATP-binding protein [Flavobacteriaceae]TEW76560.1 PAS domain-containing hybrid sensor histidine kinase/response regulator [Gramella jeungdoensis]GGK54018.1 hypothetical protein GCM10007963_22890 [Lutibacter litoralis]
MDLSSFFKYATPVIYWLLIITWALIFGFYMLKVKSVKTKDSLLRLLLIILAIDAFRSFFESTYFGLWYTSFSGLLPRSIFNFLNQPEIVFVPKMFNLITTYIIVTILIRKWLVAEISQKKELNDLVDLQNSRLIHKNKKLLEAKEQAEENEEKLSRAIMALPFPTMIHANDGEVLIINENWEKLTGYSHKDIPTISDWTKKAFGNESEQREISIYKLYDLDKKAEEGEFEVLTSKGTKLVWDFNSAPFGTFSDGRKLVITVAKDVTDYKRASLEVHNQKKLFETMFNTITDGVVITNTKREIILANKGMETTFGFKPKELMGKSTKLLYADSLKYADTGTALFDKNAKSSDNLYVTLYKDKNNDVFPGETFGTKLFDSNNKWIGNLGIIRNISERQNLISDLKLAKEHAEESDRLKSAFLANMSHEIRTPMNGILGFAQLLKTQDLSGENQQKYIDVIEKSGERMLNIINDIVSISKIESGLIGVHLEETNFNEQVEFIYNFFKPEIESKNLQFLLKNGISFNEAIIYTDREKVFAILTNLMKNAIKYTEKGFIELGYFKKDNFLQFYIKDSGIGIPKDRQKAIFERFIQADISNKNAKQGAGLGLSITKAYVEILGGDLWVTSEKGKGSTFYFTLPYQTEIISDKIKKIEVLAPAEISLTKKLKILIVDDDETSEMILSISLEEFAKEIIVARNGVEAVQACRKHPNIDLILMDIQMPEMNGFEATKEIRKFNPKVNIIAQTAYALIGDKEKVIEVGCNSYIKKPIDVSILKEKISELI